MDGADPALALKWADEGHLPALRSLLQRGSGGVLLSTPNAMSPAAWSSFATGLNPGRHGIFYFLDRKPGTYELMHSGPRTRTGTTFWSALSAAGKRVAVLHEPMTYPAEAVNGVQLCGWLAPGTNAPGYTYPANFIDELRRQFPDFVLHTGMTEYVRRGRYDLALEKKLASVRTKGKIARWVWEREDWDCFITVFDETDPVSHYFWHFMDPDHPEHESAGAQRYDLAILDVYRAVDDEIDPGWDLSKTPLWVRMKELNAETARLGQLVITGQSLPALTVDNKDVQAAAWQSAGQTQVLVTNPTARPQTAILKLERAVTVCKCLHGDGDTEVVDRAVRVSLPAYGSATLAAQ